MRPLVAHGGSVETDLSVHSILFEDFLQSPLPSNARWSFSAVDINTGKQIMNAGNSVDVPLIPGSLEKLLIIATAMDLNSKEKISMDTIIAHDGTISNGKLRGNLYIKGSGNAFLSEKDLEMAVEEIRSKGIKEIAGDMVDDDSLFETTGWKHDYQGPAYALPGALGLDLHTVSVTVLGRPPNNVRMEPSNEAVKVIFTNDGAPSIRQIDDLTYEVRGRLSDSTIIRKRFPLKDPSAYAALTLKTLLKKKGVSFEGRILRGKTPAEAKEIFTIKSESFPEIARDTNRNSLNVVADNLLLLIGAKRFGVPGTTEKGLEAVKEFLRSIGLSSKDIVLEDGSGLSHEDRITSGWMTDFLEAVSKKPWFNAFYESLPKAGIDGTLKDIGYRNEHIRAKTGQLRDASCIAGYLERGDKSRIAFSYMVNVPGADLLHKDIGPILERLYGERL